MPGKFFRYADLAESAEKNPPGDEFLFSGAVCEGSEQTLLDCDIGELFDTAHCDLGFSHQCVTRDDVFLYCTNLDRLEPQLQNLIDENITSSNCHVAVLFAFNVVCLLPFRCSNLRVDAPPGELQLRKVARRLYSRYL